MQLEFAHNYPYFCPSYRNKQHRQEVENKKNQNSSRYIKLIVSLLIDDNIIIFIENLYNLILMINT